MISSTSSTDRSHRPEILSAPGKAAVRQNPTRTDQISTQGAEFLRAELQRQPEVRPEVVSRAKALADDPNYPSLETIRNVAEQILAAPDLSEDES